MLSVGEKIASGKEREDIAHENHKGVDVAGNVRDDGFVCLCGNVDAAVKKSFELPKATKGRLLAVGGGVTAGEAGESYVQHPHKWAYAVEDGKIIAYCVADDGEPCSYRDHSRGPFIAVSAADAAYTAMRYDELTAVNGITPVTGVVVAPETYAGRDGTDYPESSTPPRDQGAYTVSMQLGDLRITSDFTITEPKPSQGSVYQRRRMILVLW